MSNTIHHPLIRPSKHSLHCRTFLPPLFSTLNIPHSQSDTDIQPWQRVARQSDRLNSVLCPNQSPVGMALVSSQSLVFSHLSYVVCFWLKEYLNTSVYLKKIFFFWCFICFDIVFFGIFWSLQTRLLCKVGDLAGGKSVAVGVSDWWQVTGDRQPLPHDILHVALDTWHVTHDTQHLFIYFYHFVCFFPFLSVSIRFCPFGIGASIRTRPEIQYQMGLDIVLAASLLRFKAMFLTIQDFLV